MWYFGIPSVIHPPKDSKVCLPILIRKFKHFFLALDKVTAEGTVKLVALADKDETVGRHLKVAEKDFDVGQLVVVEESDTVSGLGFLQKDEVEYILASRPHESFTPRLSL